MYLYTVWIVDNALVQYNLIPRPTLLSVPQFVLTVMYGSGRGVKKDSFCFRVLLSTQTE